MKIVLAADHGGVDLKDAIAERLRAEGYDVEDQGTHSHQSVDYPVFAFRAAKMVANGEAERGILCCGTGIGMSIAANKVRGIFCAKVGSEDEGRLASGHNHANMLALGGRTTETETAWRAVKAWLETPPEGGRHQHRVELIRAYDSGS